MLDGVPLVRQELAIGGRVWIIESVTDQDALIQQIQTEEQLENFPYGLILWPAAIALAELLSRLPLKNKRVLELGAGVGLAGLVAASHGAIVTQTDYLDHLLTLARHNAALNQLSSITTCIGDWRDWPEDLTDFDLVIGSDILYERAMHPSLATLLPKLGKEILIADPIRPQAADFLAARRAENWQIQTKRETISLENKPREIAIHRIHT
jgi:predicted nicotinamide N-methyase